MPSLDMILQIRHIPEFAPTTIMFACESNGGQIINKIVFNFNETLYLIIVFTLCYVLHINFSYLPEWNLIPLPAQK